MPAMSNHTRLSWRDTLLRGSSSSTTTVRNKLHAVGQQRQSATMSEDPLDIGIAQQRAGEDKVADRACGVE